MDAQRALQTVGALAREHGIDAAPVVLKVAHNVVAAVGPVVARAATPMAQATGRDAAWFAREIAVVRHVAAAGAPVADAAPDPLAGPHEHDGLIVTFWRRLEHDPHAPWEADAVAAALRRVYVALDGYRGELPALWPLTTFDWITDRLDLGSDAALLRRARDRLVAVLEENRSDARLLHGDAHVGNCLKTGGGPVWIDFEDICAAPIEWDAACIALAAEIGTAGPVARDLYARVYDDVDATLLSAMIEFRAAVVAQWAAYVHGGGRHVPWLDWLRARLSG